MAGTGSANDLDLPLMSSIHYRHIHHYILDLTCDFNEQVFRGCVTLFSNNVLRSKGEDFTEMSDSQTLSKSEPDVDCKALENSNSVKNKNSNSSDHFVLVLDSWDITVDKIEELSTPALNEGVSIIDMKQSAISKLINEAVQQPMNFTCEKQCIRMWKDGVWCSKDFPDIVRIFYSTNPAGRSLKWTKDQDGNACVYTHGHWINNRSLFPSQDIPEAMASWRAYIHAPVGMIVIMTGDQHEDILQGIDGYQTHYFYSKMEMPSSTLALAIGHWREVVSENNHQNDRFVEDQTPCTIPYRVFAPECLTNLAKDVLYPYISQSLLAASDLLGCYPFYRLDVLIVPASFNSLGMASPSLMFLSQSSLSDDGGMLVRVSHEISHSWFGLLIGPKDWTEEWLSEGFCTYTEGIIHSKALKMSVEEIKERRELLDYLKYKTLQTELDNTDVDLQTLRPNKDQIETDGDGISYVKNGMNPDKGFTQLHYLKGYFLLCFLESLVGLDGVCLYLKQVVEKFHHQLVNSQDVISLFLYMYPEECKSKISLDFIYKEWLDNAGMPQFLSSYILTVCENQMFQVVSENILHFKHVNTSYTALHWRKRRKFYIAGDINLKKMNLVQTLVFLEMLVGEKKIHRDILIKLNNYLRFSNSNPDIQHKWCELVIKFGVQDRYRDVEQFLIHHQAMGVYLFGELVLSKDKEQLKIAKSAFNTIQHDLEAGVYKTICSMVYGTEDISSVLFEKLV